VNGRDIFGKMGFEMKVVLLIWHSRQTRHNQRSPSSPNFVSSFVIDRPICDLSSIGISIDFARLDDADDLDGLFRPSGSQGGPIARVPLFHFLRQTFRPIFLSSTPGMLTFPSVEAMMIVFPEEDGPNSLERSILIVRIFPSTVISTFFIVPSPLP
jgi:hypothetical protein